MNRGLIKFCSGGVNDRGHWLLAVAILTILLGTNPCPPALGQDDAEKIVEIIEDDDGKIPNEDGIPRQEGAVPDIPVDKELQRKIRLLQRKLNLDDATQRDEAEKELLEIGPKALDYLPTEDPSYTAEFNARLRKVRIGLELEVAERVVRPLSITLKGEYSVAEIAAALKEQSGNSVELLSPSDQSITVDWEAKPFFAALDELAAAGSLAVQYSGTGISLYNDSNSQTIRHASYDQGFRTSAVSVRSFLDLNADSLSTQLNVNLRWEPRLRLIKLSIPLDRMKVVPAGTMIEDENENLVDAEDDEADLEPNENANRRRNLEFGVSRGESSSFFEIPIGPQPDDVKAVDVSGNFKALIAGRSEVFRFDDLEKALANKTEIEKSGIKVKLDGRTDDEYLTGYRLTISFSDAKKSLESHFGWVYENPAYLVDLEGVRHEALTVESAGQTENQSSMLFLFDKLEDAKGWKLEYHSPGILVETVVPFRLKNIRLP